MFVVCILMFMKWECIKWVVGRMGVWVLNLPISCDDYLCDLRFKMSWKWCVKVENMGVYKFGDLGSKNANLDVETDVASNDTRWTRLEDHGSVISGDKPLRNSHGLVERKELKMRTFWNWGLMEGLVRGPKLWQRGSGSFWVSRPLIVREWDLIGGGEFNFEFKWEKWICVCWMSRFLRF